MTPDPNYQKQIMRHEYSMLAELEQRGRDITAIIERHGALLRYLAELAIARIGRN